MKNAFGQTRKLVRHALGAAALAACGTSPTTFVVESDAATDAPSQADVAPDVGIDALDAAPDAPTADVPEPDTQPDLPPDLVADAELDSADASPDTPTPDVPPSSELEAACEAACSTREEVGMGGCPVSGDQECADWCIDVGPSVSTELYEAYFQCLAEDPLCFQSVLQCAISLTYPEPFAHTVTLHGTGYDAWNGLTVYAGVEETSDSFVRADTMVSGGEFLLEFDVFMYVNQSHLTLFYVDSNSSGSCDPDEDETGAGSVELWGLPADVIEVPEWQIEVVHDPERDASFVCTYL